MVLVGARTCPRCTYVLVLNDILWLTTCIASFVFYDALDEKGECTELFLQNVHRWHTDVQWCNSQAFVIASYLNLHLCVIESVRKLKKNVTFGSRSVWPNTRSWSVMCNLPLCTVQSDGGFNLSPCLLSLMYNDVAQQWCTRCTYMSYVSICNDVL